MSSSNPPSVMSHDGGDSGTGSPPRANQAPPNVNHSYPSPFGGSVSSGHGSDSDDGGAAGGGGGNNLEAIAKVLYQHPAIQAVMDNSDPQELFEQLLNQ